MFLICFAFINVTPGILEGGNLTFDKVLACPHHPLQSSAIEVGVVSIPNSDAACQDALDGAAVEHTEDAGAHADSPQASEAVQSLGPSHYVCAMCGLCEVLGDVYPKELEFTDPLHYLLCFLKSTINSLVFTYCVLTSYFIPVDSVKKSVLHV